jgi:hypothetical protein
MRSKVAALLCGLSLGSLSLTSVALAADNQTILAQYYGNGVHSYLACHKPSTAAPMIRVRTISAA